MNAKAAELKEQIERGEYPSQDILDVASGRALCDALWGNSSDLEGDTGGKQESPPPVPPPVSGRSLGIAIVVGVCGFGILAVAALSAIVGG